MPIRNKTCCYCHRPANALTRIKFPTFYLCSKCRRQISPWFRLLNSLTPADIAAHMEYRMRNKQALADFHPTLTAGNTQCQLYLDENTRRFVLAPSSLLQKWNPDLMFLDQLTDAQIRRYFEFYVDPDSESIDSWYDYTDYLVLSFEGHPFIKKIAVEVRKYRKDTGSYANEDKNIRGGSFSGQLDAKNLEKRLREYREDEAEVEMAYILQREIAKNRPAAQPAAPAPQAAPTPPVRTADSEGWTCVACGGVSRGNFCMDCGARRPSFAPLYRCDVCGWKPEDPRHPPKFCPECGDPFNEGDIYTMTEEAEDDGTL